jgi:hypothetical protein
MTMPRLTSISHGGGCGCKIAPRVLADLLTKSATPTAFAQLLVGTETAGDAAVYQLNEEQAIVATTDFFMPIVAAQCIRSVRSSCAKDESNTTTCSSRQPVSRSSIFSTRRRGGGRRCWDLTVFATAHRTARHSWNGGFLTLHGFRKSQAPGGVKSIYSSSVGPFRLSE